MSKPRFTALPVTRFAIVCAIVAALGQPAAIAQVVLPAGFQPIEMSPVLSDPVAMAFAGDGRIFVAEQGGIVRVIQNNTIISTFIDLSAEVNSSDDRGLLGLALDPSFLTNHRVYLMYGVDPTFGPPDEDGAVATFTRVTRYTGSAASNGNVADVASRAILIGQQPGDGIPICYRSHSSGALRFAPDGTLLVSHGDGAMFAVVDSGGQTPTCFQSGMFNAQQDIGAFRAQMLGSMGGKILRVDPATGNGLPSNPYWQGNASDPRARVWLSGLRNPFRFCIRPGTGSASTPGTLYIGDVGWSTYEEVDIASSGGGNYGWPCYEGFSAATDYPAVDLSQWDCATIGTASNPGPLTAPVIAYHHFNAMLSNPPGYTGACVIGGVFHSGNNYPSPFRNAYFYADFTIGWIKVMRVDATNHLQGIYGFATNADGPVDFAVDPLTGEVCYLSMFQDKIIRLHSLIRPGDVDRNGVVNVNDLLQVVSHWGPCGTPLSCPADLNVSGQIDVNDLLEVITNWG